MKIHLNSRLPKHFVFTNFKNIFLLLFVCLSIYGCYLVQILKKDTEILNQSINKINKELTPKPTIKPTITPTPTPEYIFIAMPNSGIVLSCKKSSQQALIQASTSVDSAWKVQSNCEKSYINDCKKECKKGDLKCESQCISNIPHSCSNEENEKNTGDALNKLIKENCMGNNQL